MFSRDDELWAEQADHYLRLDLVPKTNRRIASQAILRLDRECQIGLTGNSSAQYF
jgi:hypothetical protein